MLYRSLCGRMRMARASRYVCATILVQTSKVMLLLWLESLVGELGISLPIGYNKCCCGIIILRHMGGGD